VHIKVQRSGGYAGISEEIASIDTAQLDPEAASRIEQLIGQTRFFDLPAEAPGGVGADFFRYEVTVTDNGRQHTVAFADDGGPETEPLRKLVETVSAAG
jgi:emfourin